MDNNRVRSTGLRAGLSRHKYLVALVVLIVVIIALYSFSFWSDHLPLGGSGYDTYSHLGLLRAVKSQMGLGSELAPGMFPDLYKGNARNGINYVMMSLISVLPASSNIFALYIFGLLGIIIFLTGIYYLTFTLSRSHRAAFLAALLSMLICGFDVS